MAMVESAIVDRYREKYDVPQNTEHSLEKTSMPQHTMLPSFHHSTSAPAGPWAGRSGWLRPYHGATRAGPAQQRRSSAYQALPLTAALRRAERADGLIFRNVDRFSQRAFAAHY